MKKFLILGFAFIILACLPACSFPANPAVSGIAPNAPPVTVAPQSSPQSTPIISPAILPTPTPTPSVFGETPEHAGSGDVLFDIYTSTALVDLNKDGAPEQLTFTKGSTQSTLQINGTSFAIKHSGLAQLFAVTDVDISDNTLELAFTDKYSSDLADTEFPFTWLYWWNGTSLIQMGGLMDMKFDGAWKSDFHPKDYLDAHGMVMCLTRTQEFSDAWYTGHYKPDGTDRKLKEDLYTASVLFHQDPLKLKYYIILLKKIDSKYFAASWDVIWDYASLSGGYGTRPRAYSDEIVAFIPQAGEQLTIIKVYGKNWFKLKASDGKQGWLKCVDGKIQGYSQVMHYTAADIFDGIVIAG